MIEWQNTSPFPSPNDTNDEDVEIAMQNIEAQGKVIPGVTCWCLKCRNISVLSYSNYRLLLSRVNCGDVMDPVNYYSRVVGQVPI